MHGGGMGLGVGRGQIELLAALFRADPLNDVAPSTYNEHHPARELPASPWPRAPTSSTSGRAAYARSRLVAVRARSRRAGATTRTVGDCGAASGDFSHSFWCPRAVSSRQFHVLSSASSLRLLTM